ncbi:MAG TPA: hydrolase [Candidatus Bathyarchaeia archaeon]|nr:hydrolase [Candidatus Bathyarchaeia archaeon]
MAQQAGPRAPEGAGGALARGGLIDRRHSLLVLIDVQERYIPHLFEGARVVEAIRRLVEGAKLTAVPVLVTEQYPKGLGHITSSLRDCLPAGQKVIEKSSLSCLGAPEFVQALGHSTRRQLIVTGIEAHACVNQTVHDLLERGVEVYLPVDAISSRYPRDYEIALRRLDHAGAVLTTTEAVLLEWVRTAEAPEFQAIRNLIRDPLPGAA